MTAAIVGIMVNLPPVRVVENGIFVAIERAFNAILFTVIDLGMVKAMLLRFTAALARV